MAQPHLLCLPFELRQQTLSLVFDDALIVLENPDWDPTIRSWASWPALWRTRHELLAVCQQLRREAKPLYKLTLSLKFPNRPDNRYAWKIPRFLRSHVTKIMIPTQEWNADMIWHDIYPRLEVLVTSTQLQSSSHLGGNNRRFGAIHGPSTVHWDYGGCETRLGEIKQGIHDPEILAHIEQSDSSTWLEHADRIYKERQFTIHCQALVRLQQWELSCKPIFFTMALYWDYDSKTVLERHWLENAHMRDKDRVDCLSTGYCSTCSEDGVVDKDILLRLAI